MYRNRNKAIVWDKCYILYKIINLCKLFLRDPPDKIDLPGDKLKNWNWIKNKWSYIENNSII